MTEIPKYIGSWKGRVIKAIAFDGAKTWNEIREVTGLHPKTLNMVLKELFDVGSLSKNEKNEYRVEYLLYKQYQEYYQEQTEKEKSSPQIKFSEEVQRNLIHWLAQWNDLNNLKLSLENKHFYLEGRNLDSLSQGIILNAKQEILVTTPWIRACSLSNALREPAKKKVKISVVTRPSEEDSKYHNILKKEKIRIYYNNKIHSKMIIVDRIVAIVSSMNFIVQSSGGQSWEAGLVTIDPEVVQSITNSVLNFIELPETINKE